MGETVGSIYILTNRAMPGWVKIGYADDVAERVQILNSSDGVPFPFYVYATYDVPVRLADRKLHQIIDQLNPELRAVEVRDGKTRTREFYAMSPEAAFDLIKAIAELHGFENRLRRWGKSDEDKQNDENAAKAEKAKARMEAFRFSQVEIPEGSFISFKDDETKKAEVISDRRVRYEGKDYSLSSLALLLTGREGTIQGPLYFTYEGELLTDRRKRLSEE